MYLGIASAFTVQQRKESCKANLFHIFSTSKQPLAQKTNIFTF